MVNESHYARMPLFKAWRLLACLSPSLCLSQSLSLPPRWSSQLGWMRLIFNSSCANAFLALWECSMHPNLTHCLIYFLPQKVWSFICERQMAIFGRISIFFGDFITVLLGFFSNSWRLIYKNALRFILVLRSFLVACSCLIHERCWA